MSAREERIQILEMIEQDAISAEEGLTLLKALEDSEDKDNAVKPKVPTRVGKSPGAPIESAATIKAEDLLKWNRWWIIPFLMGVGITLLGGSWMYTAWNTRGFGFLFLLTWIPFLAGVGILALAWGSRNSPWLHLRIHQKPGLKPRRIALSFPIPIRLILWISHTFGDRIPHMDLNRLDEVLLALQDSAHENMPLIIDVDEEDEGESVKVIII